jgi:glycosyltransferase involved in cell wall biosynthesis
VIATRCCGEVVEQGESGMLIPPRDSRSLADAILRFVEDRDVLPRMSRNALKRTEDFTPAAVWPHYASVLQGSQGSQLACAPPGKSV